MGRTVPAMGKDFTKTLLTVSKPMDRFMSLSFCAYQITRRFVSEKLPTTPGLPFASSMVLATAMCFSYRFRFSSKAESNLMSLSSQMSANSCYSSNTEARKRSNILI
jgi:hypothetical protein